MMAWRICRATYAAFIYSQKEINLHFCVYFLFLFFKERKKECFKGGVGSAGTAGRNVEVKHEFSLMLTKKRVGESSFEMNTQSTVKIVSWNLLKALL